MPTMAEVRWRRVVPAFEVLSEAHLFDVSVDLSTPYASVVPWVPPLDSDLADRIPPRVLLAPDGLPVQGVRLVSETPRATRCGRPVTDELPWLPWPNDDPLPLCQPCENPDLRDEQAVLL